MNAAQEDLLWLAKYLKDNGWGSEAYRPNLTTGIDVGLEFLTGGDSDRMTRAVTHMVWYLKAEGEITDWSPCDLPTLMKWEHNEIFMPEHGPGYVARAVEAAASFTPVPISYESATLTRELAG